MSVEREQVHAPDTFGSAVVTRIYRGASGKWSVELDLNFEILVGDGRKVFVRRFVNVVATEQRGRRRSVKFGRRWSIQAEDGARPDVHVARKSCSPETDL